MQGRLNWHAIEGPLRLALELIEASHLAKGHAPQYAADAQVSPKHGSMLHVHAIEKFVFFHEMSCKKYKIEIVGF